LKNKPSRNDTCNCGSGKKFKNCHGKSIEKSSQIWVIIAVVLLLLIWFLFFETKAPEKATNYTPTPLAPKKLQTSTAPGPAPPGKVWSVEHGHWHNAPLAPTSLPSKPETSTPKAPPPGDPPPGKVWSPEHGHWHDQN